MESMDGEQDLPYLPEDSQHLQDSEQESSDETIWVEAMLDLTEELEDSSEQRENSLTKRSTELPSPPLGRPAKIQRRTAFQQLPRETRKTPAMAEYTILTRSTSKDSQPD